METYCFLLEIAKAENKGNLLTLLRRSLSYAKIEIYCHTIVFVLQNVFPMTYIKEIFRFSCHLQTCVGAGLHRPAPTQTVGRRLPPDRIYHDSIVISAFYSSTIERTLAGVDR